MNLGLDHLVKADEESAWLFGGAFRYSDADQKGLGVGYTTGTLQEYVCHVDARQGLLCRLRAAGRSL